MYLVYSSAVDRVCVSQQSFYDFRYDDEDTVMNEIDEFYSYVEMPQVAENLKAWQGSFSGGTLLSSTTVAVRGDFTSSFRLDKPRNYRCAKKDPCRPALGKPRAP